MSNMVVSMAGQLADSLGFSGVNGSELLSVLKATAFKGQVSDAQMAALLIVAKQYALNPWTKEIYAFPDRQNGIVPVVGVDGWSRIINGHSQFDGMDFDQDAESCTCVIYRKDRSHPIKVTEFMAECKRPNVGPWQSHPRRMLRHKAMIQCARLAFGFTGIVDEDEAERIGVATQAAQQSNQQAQASDLMPRSVNEAKAPIEDAEFSDQAKQPEQDKAGFVGLSDGQIRVVRAAAKRASIETDDNLFAIFAVVSSDNINTVLSDLRERVK
jgi:phage recombination protein Bet